MVDLLKVYVYLRIYIFFRDLLYRICAIFEAHYDYRRVKSQIDEVAWGQ